MKLESRRLRRVGLVVCFASLMSLLPDNEVAAQRSRTGMSRTARRSIVQWNRSAPTQPGIGAQGLNPLTVAGARRHQLRRMMVNGQTPSLAAMQGYWHGVNKGIGPALMGFSQFTKEFGTQGSANRGGNIVVRQVPVEQLGRDGWRPMIDPATGGVQRRGSFAITAPTGRGRLGHARELNYRAGNNPHGDPSRLLVDKIVMLDANHMLGRATIKLGPIRIPVAYFALERIQ